MYSVVGIEPQWLAAAAAGSSRLLLSYSPAAPSLSSFWYASQTCRHREAVKVLATFRFKNASQQGGFGVGKSSICNGGGFWVPRKVHMRIQHGRYCAEEFPTRAGHGEVMRFFFSLSRRQPKISASAVPSMTDGIHTEERVESALKDFILDSRTTSIAHKVWQSVVRQGDTVVDATCGNGLDTLVLAKLVLKEGTAGYVIGLDIQESALDNTSALLDRELNSSQREKVSLLQFCHSQLDKVVDESSVRLVVFNLGYQPGGDKSIITRAETTVKAVGAAVNVLERQGLISILSYVGHPGGREEYDAVRDFLAGLPPQDWVCNHLEWINRPLSPHLLFVLRK